MAKAKAKVSKVKDWVRFKKRRQRNPLFEEAENPVERMRHALGADGESTQQKVSVLPDEDPFDLVAKIRSAGY
jgi:hypothetical protein